MIFFCMFAVVYIIQPPNHIQSKFIHTHNEPYKYVILYLMQFYFSIIEIRNYSSMLFNDTNSKYCCKCVYGKYMSV